MAVTHEVTVQRYAQQHYEMYAMLKNLMEFVATMPAPDENNDLQNVDFGYTGSVGEMHYLLKQASDIANEMSK